MREHQQGSRFAGASLLSRLSLVSSTSNSLEGGEQLECWASAIITETTTNIATAYGENESGTCTPVVAESVVEVHPLGDTVSIIKAEYKADKDEFKVEKGWLCGIWRACCTVVSKWHFLA